MSLVKIYIPTILINQIKEESIISNADLYADSVMIENGYFEDILKNPNLDYNLERRILKQDYESSKLPNFINNKLNVSKLIDDYVTFMPLIANSFGKKEYKKLLKQHFEELELNDFNKSVYDYLSNTSKRCNEFIHNFEKIDIYELEAFIINKIKTDLKTDLEDYIYSCIDNNLNRINEPVAPKPKKTKSNKFKRSLKIAGLFSALFGSYFVQLAKSYALDTGQELIVKMYDELDENGDIGTDGISETVRMWNYNGEEDFCTIDEFSHPDSHLMLQYVYSPDPDNNPATDDSKYEVIYSVVHGENRWITQERIGENRYVTYFYNVPGVENGHYMITETGLSGVQITNTLFDSCFRNNGETYLDMHLNYKEQTSCGYILEAISGFDSCDEQLIETSTTSSSETSNSSNSTRTNSDIKNTETSSPFNLEIPEWLPYFLGGIGIVSLISGVAYAVSNKEDKNKHKSGKVENKADDSMLDSKTKFERNKKDYKDNKTTTITFDDFFD